jgi:hypothetical protein
MNTKSDCRDDLALNLAKTALWRKLQAQRWPDDTRNARAADALSVLALQSTELDDSTWDRLSPYFDPKDPHWRDAVSAASRAVGFRATCRTFDDYLQTVLDALVVTP